MSKNRIVQAWKNAEFRATLSAEELASLPENPAGAIELTDDELDGTVGGATESRPRTYTRTWCGSCTWLTLDCCGGPTVTCG